MPTMYSPDSHIVANVGHVPVGWATPFPLTSSLAAKRQANTRLFITQKNPLTMSNFV